MNNNINDFILINKACEEIKDFKKYIDIIQDTSQTPIEDLKSLELILVNHTTQQVFEFMPRFISLL